MPDVMWLSASRRLAVGIGADVQEEFLQPPSLALELVDYGSTQFLAKWIGYPFWPLANDARAV